MAYTAVPTAYSSSPKWSATWVNKYLQANFAAGIPDIFTTKGDLAVATAADAATRLGVGANDCVLWSNSDTTNGINWGGAGYVKVNDDAGGQVPDLYAWSPAITINNEYYDLGGTW